MSAPKPIHDDISVERAWQIGRRIYVSCHYESSLGTRLRADLGAHWDRDRKCLWVGSGKKAQVIEEVRATDLRRARVEEIKRTGRPVAIPFTATRLRALAKEQGEAIWDDERKVWVFPREPEFDAVYHQVRDGVAEIRQKAAETARHEEQLRREERARIRAAEQEWVEKQRVEQRVRVLEKSGRAATGEQTAVVVVSTRRMNKATAREMAYPLGTVLRLDDGRRGVVVEHEVWFTGEEMASSVCWHPETHDMAHWDLKHVVAVVEPTIDELSADEAERAAAADAAEIHQFVNLLSRAGAAVAGWSRIDPDTVVGVIEAWYGSGGMGHRSGTVTLTRDEQVIFQHPGYYDEFVRTERVLTDPALVARMRAVLAAGPRKCLYPDQTVYRYEVSVRDEKVDADGP
ncbi:hypothetical protein ACFWPH_28460 [Nocardia sp. NPDC058499]|uniref:hypothetical protein n=1 Tax=Nocardia sp. NPDC058499 TaxID=3346530 RepID=UPI0036485FD6